MQTNIFHLKEEKKKNSSPLLLFISGKMLLNLALTGIEKVFVRKWVLFSDRK